MTQECIPILFKLSSRNRNHSCNLAPSIPCSGGGGGGTPPNQTSARIRGPNAPAAAKPCIREFCSASLWVSWICESCIGTIGRGHAL